MSIYFFRGAEMDDPDGLLEGSGKGMRHVKLREPKDAAHAQAAHPAGVPHGWHRHARPHGVTADEYLALYVMSLKVLRDQKAALAKYELGKGTVKFTPDAPLPTALVTKIVKARAAELHTAGR